MPKIKRIFLFSVFIILCGCAERVEIYGFKSIGQKFDWGVVEAKLSGTRNRPFFTVEIGRPYKLFISFMSEKRLDAEIIISSIEIKGSNSNKIFFKNRNPISKAIVKSEYLDYYEAYFSYKGLDIDHTDVKVNISFSMKKNQIVTNYKAKLSFKKEYEKRWQIVSH